MSGTSLDGVDLCAVTFVYNSGKWNYTVGPAETIPYDEDRRRQLLTLHLATAAELAQMHTELGRHFATLINVFCKEHELKPDLIGSHGHTIFHQPSSGFTLQIGDAAQIAALTNTDTIADFRTKDIAHGGQGAPLVPIGDKLLFADYTFCLNLGGIANLSYDHNDQRIAFDICPVNMIFNALASRLGQEFDRNGSMAEQGKLIFDLLDDLNALEFYKSTSARSLGREWFENSFLPVIEKYSYSSVHDLLATVVEHAAVQIASVINAANKKGSVLVTGGGAFNEFFIRRLAAYCNNSLEVPDETLVSFKEAIVFAFLAALNYSGQVNVVGSATGSGVDHTGGALYRAG